MVRRKYGCTQAQLVAICIMILDAYDVYQPIFEAASPYYTTALSTARRAAIFAAMAMPNRSQRNIANKNIRKQLRDLNADVCAQFLILKRFIDFAFPNNLANEYIEAGQNSFVQAAKKKWAITLTLLFEMEAYLAAKATALEAGDNMPAAFVTAFATLKAAYIAKYSQYMLARSTIHNATDDKQTAYNALYDDAISMCKFAQFLPLPPAAFDQFNFAHLLSMVSGASPAGFKGVVVDAVTGLPINNAVITVYSLIMQTVYSNAAGKYKINLPSGNYYVKVTAPSAGIGSPYITQYTMFTVQVGTFSTMNFQLYQ